MGGGPVTRAFIIFGALAAFYLVGVRHWPFLGATVIFVAGAAFGIALLRELWRAEDHRHKAREKRIGK